MTSQAARETRHDTRTRGTNLAPVLLLVGVWVAFTAFTIAVLFDFGPVGFVEAALANGATTQVSIDLVVSLVIALVFIRADARRRGLPYWPYVVVAALTGSIALLAYVIHRTISNRLSPRREPVA